MKLTEHFTESEFLYSETAIKHKIKNVWNESEKKNAIFLCKTILEPFRIHLNSSLKITSGFRSEALNKVMPGASKDSAHMKGLAADISSAIHPPALLFDKLHKFMLDNKIEWDQLILETNVKGGFSWVHIAIAKGSNRHLVFRMKV